MQIVTFSCKKRFIILNNVPLNVPGCYDNRISLRGLTKWSINQSFIHISLILPSIHTYNVALSFILGTITPKNEMTANQTPKIIRSKCSLFTIAIPSWEAIRGRDRAQHWLFRKFVRRREGVAELQGHHHGPCGFPPSFMNILIW